MAFDAASHGRTQQQAFAPEPSPQASGDGVYAYSTNAGVRYRFVFRQSDGTLSSRRGFRSQAAAAARRKVAESVDRREITVCREDFADFWERFVADKRPYLTPGSHVDLVTHGRKRLLPFFGTDQLSSIDPERIRDWLAVMVELIEAEKVAPKTGNNARTYLSMAFTEAVRRGLLARNPCDGVPALPVDRTEVEFLRLVEIDTYLSACSDAYRPLAEFLIGTGTRVSEAVATRWADIDLEEGIVRVYRQRDRGSSATRTTKGKRFRSVQMGPRLVATLRSLRVGRLSGEIADDGLGLPVSTAPPRALRGSNDAGAASPQDRARLARGRAPGRRDPRLAAACASAHGRRGVARGGPPADLRAASAWPPVDHDDLCLDRPSVASSLEAEARERGR